MEGINNRGINNRGDVWGVVKGYGNSALSFQSFCKSKTILRNCVYWLKKIMEGKKMMADSKEFLSV